MEQKVVVITGASGGIGAALARNLGAKGHSIVLGARRENELTQVAEQTGTLALPVVTDVTRRSDIEHLRDIALKEFGHVDVWINNAGRGIGIKIMDMTEDDLDEMLRVNLKSVFYGIQVIIPHFQQRGVGHLINVSSFLGRVPLVSVRAAYSAAKSAVNSLTANLRMDLKATHPNIHVSLVLPGMVATNFAKNALGGIPIIPGGAGAGGIQSATEVAEKIASLIERPAPELYTNEAQIDLLQQYYRHVGAFEDNMRRRAVEKPPDNVHFIKPS